MTYVVGLETTKLTPFGLEVSAPAGTGFADVDPAALRAWVAEHRVVVLRGLETIPKADLPLCARRLGPLQVWEFGSIHELVQRKDATNYLYTDHDVPLHWDGAFTDRVPHFLVFHCVEAPPPGAGGETVFADTAAVWARACEATRERWRSIAFRYETEKVAHYGGAFEAPLVSRHPCSGETVLRFAEPVADLNPVRVSAPGRSDAETDALVAELSRATRRSEVALVHAWRPGDVVIADNHALLHGRRAFSSDAPRRIRRVNVHDERTRRLDWLANSLVIRRPEFMVAEAPIFVIPWLAAPASDSARAPGVLLPLCGLFVLLFHFGDLVNCYADRKLDSVYKPRLSEAVFALGERNVRWQIGITAALALALAGHLSTVTGDALPLGLVVSGLAIGAQYSLRPLWLKGRGLAQVVTLCAVIFVGPMLLVTVVSGAALTAELLVLFLAYAAMQEGIILVNTAEDLPEDTEAGIRTAAVAMGLAHTLTLALAMVLVGGLGVLAVLAAPAVLAGRLPAPSVCLLVVAWGYAALGIARARAAVAARDPQHAVATLRLHSRRVPLWIAATAWGTLLAVWGR